MEEKGGAAGGREGSRRGRRAGKSVPGLPSGGSRPLVRARGGRVASAPEVRVAPARPQTLGDTYSSRPCVFLSFRQEKSVCRGKSCGTRKLKESHVGYE